MNFLFLIFSFTFLNPTSGIAHEPAVHRCLIEEVRYSGEEGYRIDSYIDGMECGNGYFVINGVEHSMRSCGIDLNHKGWVVRVNNETTELFQRKRQAVEEALFLREEGKCIFPAELVN